MRNVQGLDDRRKRQIVHIILFGLLALAVLLLLSANASADTHVYTGAGVDALASNGNNWNLADAWTTHTAPEAGDNLVWNATSTNKACTLDQALIYGKIWVNATYSGTITQGAVNIGYFDFSLVSGTWKGVTTKTQTCSGNWTRTGGTLFNSVIQVVMTGEGKTLTTADTGGSVFRKLTVSSNITITKLWTLGLIIDSGKTVTITNQITLFDDSYQLFTNNGVLNGPGTISMLFGAADQTLNLNNINAALTVSSWSGASASRTLTLAADATMGSALTVSCAHATYTMSINANGHLLSLTSLNLNTRGVLKSTTAGARLIASNTITVAANAQLNATNIPYIDCGTNWDTSAGYYWPGTGQVNMTNNGTTKLSATQYFYSLTVASGKTRTLLSNVAIQNVKDLAGSLVEGAYSVTINGTSVNPARLNGTWDGVINITSTGASYTIYCSNAWTGTIQSQKNMTLIFTGGQLVVTQGAGPKWYNITLKSWTSPNLYKWYAGSTNAAVNLSFAASGLNANGRYNVWLDGAYSTYKIASAGGVVTWYHTTWSGHFITLRSLAIITPTPPVGSIVEDDPYYYNASGDQAGTWTIVTLHSWMAVGSANGKVTGTPSNLFVIAHAVSLRLTNANGTSFFNWTLAVTNRAAVITTAMPFDATQGEWFSFDFGSSDEGAGAVYSMICSSTDLDLNPTTGVLAGKVRSLNDIVVHLTMDDGHGSTDTRDFTIDVRPGEPEDPGDWETDARRSSRLGTYAVVALLGGIALVTAFALAQGGRKK